MISNMMCVQMQNGEGGKTPFKFTLTVGKDGWAYGYWDSQPSKSKIEPDYLHQLFKELYVTVRDAIPYMFLTIAPSSVSNLTSFSVKVKDKSGNYLSTVEFTSYMFRENLDTGFWTANNRCDYKIYQRFESLEPVLGEIIMYFKE